MQETNVCGRQMSGKLRANHVDSKAWFSLFLVGNCNMVPVPVSGQSQSLKVHTVKITITELQYFVRIMLQSPAIWGHWWMTVMWLVDNSHEFCRITAANSRHMAYNDQTRYAPSQWDTLLQCNKVCHCLGTYLDLSLAIYFQLVG